MKRLLFFAAGFVLSLTASAQGIPPQLQSVAVSVAPLDSDARDCNLREDALIADMRLPIAGAGIKLNNVPKWSDPTLVLTASVMKHAGACIVDVELMLTAPAYLALTATVPVKVITWSKSYQVATSPGQTAPAVDRAVESMAKAFASDVLGSR